MYTPHAYHHPHPQALYPTEVYERETYGSQDLHRQGQQGSPSFEPYLSNGAVLPDQPNSSQTGSSSLAHALDEQAALSRARYQASHFPESEVMPHAPLAANGDARPQDIYTYDAAQECTQDEASPAVMYSDVMSDDEGYTIYGYTYDDQQVASPCESTETAYTASPPYDSQAELGYLNGHVVPLGLDYSSDEHLLTDLSSPLETLQDLTPPHASPVDIPTQHPAFQFTRSYTLAEAITPIEEHYPRLYRFSNNSPEASTIPSTSTIVGSSASAGALVYPMETDPSYHDDRPASRNSVSSDESIPPPTPFVEPKLPVRRPSPLGPSRPAPSASTQQRASSTRSTGEVAGRPGESVIKLDVNIPREPKKKPLMACLFCRERKIACGHPSPDDKDRRCNQCRRRDLACEFPKECRRGQHKRTPRLARVNAIVNGEPFPDDDILIMQPPYPQASSTSSSATFGGSPAIPKVKAKPIVAPSKERRKPGVKSTKKEDTQVAVERRAIIRLQRQMADQQHRQRLSQQQRTLAAGTSEA